MPEPSGLRPEIVRVILAAVVELTRIRQSECKHLCVENFAPDLFAKMLDAYEHGV